MEETKFWPLMFSGGYLLVTAKVAISIFVNQLNATNVKSNKAQFQFQFELSLAQLNSSLFKIYFPANHFRCLYNSLAAE